MLRSIVLARITQTRIRVHSAAPSFNPDGFICMPRQLPRRPTRHVQYSEDTLSGKISTSNPSLCFQIDEKQRSGVKAREYSSVQICEIDERRVDLFKQHVSLRRMQTDWLRVGNTFKLKNYKIYRSDGVTHRGDDN